MILCLDSDQSHVSLKTISQSCNLSEAYILQIFLVLRRVGIVDSIRGAQGGYSLSRKPSKITVGEVLRALEGPLSPVSCIVKGCKSPCARAEGCATRLLWERVMETINKTADSITLEDLVGEYLAMNHNPSDQEDYCI